MMPWALYVTSWLIASPNIASPYAGKPMPDASQLKDRIESAIPGAQAQVQSPDNVHFTARVVSERFAGLSRIEQHKLVYEIFDGELGADIHALSLKTETP